MERSLAPTCQHHPGAPAGWRCLGCEATLCPRCVVARRMQTVDLLSCALCGGEAVALSAHRTHVPLATRLRQAWRQPFSRHNLLLLVGLSIALAILQAFTEKFFVMVKSVPALFGAGIFWAFFFATIRAVSRGESDVAPPDYSDFFADFIIPGLRGMVATAVAWMPAILYAVLLGGWDVGGQMNHTLADPMFYIAGRLPSLPESVSDSPIFWLLALAGHAGLPMVVLLAAASQSMLSMLHPLLVLQGLRRMGRDYTLTLTVLAGLCVPLLGVHLLDGALRSLDLFFLARLPLQFLECLVLFPMAHVLGLLLYQRGDELGYGDASDYVAPLLAKATPATSLRPESPLLPVSEPGGMEAVQSESRLAELTAAVEARDVPKALGLYGTSSLPPGAIPAACHLFVGQAAAVQGDYALSTRALEAAADVEPDGPTAPRALVLLGRVLSEHMQDEARARQVYRYVVERYPDTEASRFAQGRLGASASAG